VIIAQNVTQNVKPVLMTRIATSVTTVCAEPARISLRIPLVKLV
jgi:hypothetical protein